MDGISGVLKLSGSSGQRRAQKRMTLIAQDVDAGNFDDARRKLTQSPARPLSIETNENTDARLEQALVDGICGYGVDAGAAEAAAVQLKEHVLPYYRAYMLTVLNHEASRSDQEREVIFDAMYLLRAFLAYLTGEARDSEQVDSLTMTLMTAANTQAEEQKQSTIALVTNFEKHGGVGGRRAQLESERTAKKEEVRRRNQELFGGERQAQEAARQRALLEAGLTKAGGGWAT